MEGLSEDRIRRLHHDVTELLWVRTALNNRYYVIAGMMSDLDLQKEMWVRNNVASE